MAAPTLLTLPVELRELIYGFLFSSYTIRHGFHGPSESEHSPQPQPSPTPSPRAALLLTCRQLAFEATHHLPLNITLHFRGTENLLTTLLPLPQPVLTRLRHIHVETAYPFPLYATDKPEYYPTYPFAHALSLLPGLCLTSLTVTDCWHAFGQGDPWRDVTTYLDIEALLHSSGWKTLEYRTPCPDFLASGYDHTRKRRPQPESWDALLKRRDPDAECELWIVPLKQHLARDEARTEHGQRMQLWSARPGHEVILNPRLAAPEQGVKGEVRVVATRGARASVVQEGMREKGSWGELKEQEGGFVREGKWIRGW